MVTPVIYTPPAFSTFENRDFENTADPVLVWKLWECILV